jgi:hypothetical protein
MSFRTLCFSANDYVRRIRHRLIDIGGHDYSLHYLLWSRAARWKIDDVSAYPPSPRLRWTGRRLARCRPMPLNAAWPLSMPHGPRSMPLGPRSMPLGPPLDAARARSMPLGPRSMPLDAARCRSAPARCRSMPLDPARCRSIYRWIL